MKKFKPELPKRRNLLSESYAWERQAGKALPTLAEVQAAYDARMREDVDPEEEGHVYEEPPYDEEEDDLYEADAAKDYDGDGKIESGSKEYLGSRDKAIKASADSTEHGNYVNKARAKAHLTKKDCHVYGIDSSGKGHEITKLDGLDKYIKFTIKSKIYPNNTKIKYKGDHVTIINNFMNRNDEFIQYTVKDKDGNEFEISSSDKNITTESLAEAFKKRMIGNLKGSEYILSETFKRK